MKLTGAFPMVWNLFLGGTDQLLFSTTAEDPSIFVSVAEQQGVRIACRWMVCHKALLWSLRITTQNHINIRCECEDKRVPTLVFCSDNAITFDERSLGADTFHAQQFLFLFLPSVDCTLQLRRGDYSLTGVSYSPEFLRDYAAGNEVLSGLMEHVSEKTVWSASDLPLDVPEKLRTLIDDVFTTHQRGLHLSYFLESRSLDILNMALERLGLDRDSLSTSLSMEAQHKIRLLHDWILAHLDYHHSLTSLSRRVAMSISAMQRTFRAVYGKSAITFLRHAKLERSRLHLEETRMSVKVISVLAGYRSFSSFSQAFREKFRMTPSEVRDAQRKTISNQRLTDRKQFESTISPTKTDAR